MWPSTPFSWNTTLGVNRDMNQRPGRDLSREYGVDAEQSLYSQSGLPQRHPVSLAGGVVAATAAYPFHCGAGDLKGSGNLFVRQASVFPRFIWYTIRQCR